MAVEALNRRDRRGFAESAEKTTILSEDSECGAYRFVLVTDPRAAEQHNNASFDLITAPKAAEQRNNAAHGASRGNTGAPDKAPEARKKPEQTAPLIISTRPMFEALVEDVQNQLPVSHISRKFHDGLVNTFVEIAATLRNRTSLNRVCLSGGTFNNLYLTVNLVGALAQSGFDVFTQNEVPAGDGGLSLGQAVVAAHQRLT